ncbi:homoserine kinase type II [Methylophilaceae bacterium]|nr:homoserine kinase type II [Methylophilaceae bacterium]
MSVFTTVTKEQLRHWLTAYPLGELLELKGIASGITNTNYFVTTSTGRYVLTLFEKNSAEELPYFLGLMTHFSEHGIPCPHPIRMHDSRTLGVLNGKPAALVSCLRGKSLEQPAAGHCAEIGRVLAKMHIAGASFGKTMINPRGAEWRIKTAAEVMPFLDAEACALLRDELVFEAGLPLSDLPQGVIHADLFRDNVLFDGNELGGLIDFYYACNDALLYDLAIAVNDWCIEQDGCLDPVRMQAMLDAYGQVRELTAAEKSAWSGMLRIAALRFWLSRLYDQYFPQDGELIHAKDPQHFQKILQCHARQQAIA